MPITINGTGSISGISAGGLPDSSVITADIAAGAVTQAKRSEDLTLATAQASTSGTSIDFTGIPSWVKRVTVMLNGVSTNGSSNPLIQLGAGSITTSGYVANSGTIQNAGASATNSYTTGFGISSANATNVLYVNMMIITTGSNSYVQSHSGGITTSGVFPVFGGGTVTLSGTLDRIRITTVNGTDTFDAGTINIMYE